MLGDDDLRRLLQDFKVLSIHDSTVIVDSNGSFSVANNGISSRLTEGEQEVIRLYQMLPIREKVELIRLLYEATDSLEAI